MDSDGYLLFTLSHRLYVQGVRLALRERLTAIFGEDWWEKGVEYALQESQVKNLHSELEKHPQRERHHLIEASHFGWIIVKHHNDGFSDAFNDTIRTFKEIRHLINLRNEWAHIHDIPPVQAIQAADLMKGILASLHREEALEIERMSQEFVLDPESRNARDSIDYLDHQDNGLDTRDLAVSPLELWRQLQSYLVVEKSVELYNDEPDESDESDTLARVTIRVHNTALNSSDWPAVCFSSVVIHAEGAHSPRNLGQLEPGETREFQFSFPVKRLVDVEFQVSGTIDPVKLLEFRRPTPLPAEIISPLQREFGNRLESIGIKEFINTALEEIGAPDANMTLADIAIVRENIRLRANAEAEKRNALASLFEEFHLSRDSTLGSRIREIILALEDFGRKLLALDAAMGQTDLAVITEAVQNLRQIQLAVLRVEDTIRTMARND